VRAFSFWRWPGTLKAGERSARAAHYDLLPTLAELTAADISNLRDQVNGKSLLTVLNDPMAGFEERMIVHHVARWADNDKDNHKYALCSVTWSNYRLVRNRPCDDPMNCGSNNCRLNALRMADPNPKGFYGDAENYKITEDGQWNLHDLSKDPGESDNVADKYPEVVQKMSDYYEKWWAGMKSHIK